MKFPELVPGVFIQRNNRFTAGIRLESGGVTAAFIPTTGRLTGALRPGCRVWLEQVESAHRKTEFNLVLTELDHGGLCSVNAMMANRLFTEGVSAGRLTAFPYVHIDREVTLGRSRLDFRLTRGDEICWVEVKSVTYVEKGVGMFPDAPTGRGRRHLEELAKLAAGGARASAVFIAQREDPRLFTPFEDIDPMFAETLRRVHRAGVEVHAYRCDVHLEGIVIADEIPVKP